MDLVKMTVSMVGKCMINDLITDEYYLDSAHLISF